MTLRLKAKKCRHVLRRQRRNKHEVREDKVGKDKHTGRTNAGGARQMRRQTLAL